MLCPNEMLVFSFFCFPSGRGNRLQTVLMLTGSARKGGKSWTRAAGAQPV